MKRKKKTEEQIAKENETREKDWAMYNSIWRKRPHFCEETGAPLGYTPKSTMFHHILEKSVYPEYRWEEWNIALLHPDVHNSLIHGFDHAPKTKFRTELLKKKLKL